MAHKRKPEEKEASAPYTIQDAMKVTEDIFNLSKEKQYKMGPFIHGLIFSLEYAILTYNIPQQQIANIKRDCRRYFKEMANLKQPK